MSKQANDLPNSEPQSEVDALVQTYLARQAAQVDGAAGLARVRAGLGVGTKAAAARRRRFVRLAVAAGIAAAVALAFLGGWYLSPAQAGARELVEEVKRVHNLPLARCYLVEMQRLGADEEDRPPAARQARQVRVWTRGDRFWVDMRYGDTTHGEGTPPFIWGRGDDGTLWAVLDPKRGVRAPIEQTPRPLQRIAELYTLNVDTLLDDVLKDCTLSDEPAQSKLQRVVSAEPRSERTKRWLGRVTLEIDNEAKVLRRLVIVRNLLGRPQATVTFTLLETLPDEDAKYRLEGHLAEPFRIHEGNLEPRIKLELLARWFGIKKDGRDPRNEQRDRNGADASGFKDVDGREQQPLSAPDRKATVLFFLLPDCPISNAYAPEIKRIAAEYAPKKVAAFVVHADPDVTAARAKQHATAYDLAFPVLLDPTHLLVKTTKVTMAPEVAVLGPDQKVLYRGRIDDWYAAIGKRRAAPTQRDLRNALDAILQGKTVATPTTPVIGCYLPEAKEASRAP